MKQLVCLSHEPWSHSPTRTQQLITRLREAEVLFFQPPSGPKDKACKEAGRRVRPNITVYTLPAQLALPAEFDVTRRRALTRVTRFLIKTLQKHRFQEPALWLTNPGYHALPQQLPHRGLIYDCAAEWDSLPLDWESELAFQSDVIFAASPGLVRRLEPCCDNIALIPNGVNCSLFCRDDLAPPRFLLKQDKPILCRVGSVTEELDLEPLLFAASSHPEWTFLLLGHVDDAPRQALSHCTNILMPGQVPMVDVPDYLSGCDVCFDLLSRRTRGTDILPARLYEYLAMGKPVVLMLVPDQVEPFPDVVYTASDPAAFLRRCEHALAESPTWVSGRRRAYALDSQWSDRANEIRHILETAALI